jgi:hypothetical protein
MTKKLVVGMFGTCGISTFRKDTLIPAYEKEGIEYFNPQVEDWDPSLAKIEADHLVNDQIVLFPVLGITYGTGSLAETGFSIAQAMRYDESRDFVFLIEDTLSDELMENADAAKESLRARALVSEHIKRANLPNAYIVNTIEEMLELSIVLYRAQESVWAYREKFSLEKA